MAAVQVLRGQRARLVWLTSAIFALVPLLLTVSEVASGVAKALPLPEALLSKGVGATLALGTVVILLPCVQRGAGFLFARPMLFVAAFASTVVVLRLPNLMDQCSMDNACHLGAGGVAKWLRLPLVGIVVWLLGKFVLLEWFGSVSRFATSRVAEHSQTLFKSQEDVLSTISRVVLGRPLTDPGQLVQLVGRWREGKSFVLHYLENYMIRDAPDAEKTLSVVLVDVWKHETDIDLHVAVVEQVLAHPDFLYPYGWLRYPLSMPVGRFIARIRQFKLFSSRAGVGFDLELPQLRWQKTLERLIERAWRRGRRTVVILDEIDRATPLLVQGALTIARRSLDLPSVTVLLAYVDPIIRYKAFNPLLATLPDIASSMEALIYEAVFEQHGPLAFSTPAADSIQGWEPVIERAFGDYRTMSRLSEGGLGPESRFDGLGHPRLIDLPATVRRAYEYAGLKERSKLQRKFVEKYLGTRPIQIQPLTDDEVGLVIVTLLSLRQELEKLVELGWLASIAIATSVTRAVRSWKQRSAFMRAPPPIRALEGWIFKLLSGTRLEHPDSSVVLADIVALVVAAYDVACEEQVAMGSG